MEDPDDLTLMAYADGELDSQDAKAVEIFLAQNPKKKEQVDQIRTTASLLSDTYQPTLKTAVPARVQQLLAKSKKRSEATFFRAVSSASPRQLLSLAASLVLGVGIGVGGVNVSQLAPTENAGGDDPVFVFRGVEANPELTPTATLAGENELLRAENTRLEAKLLIWSVEFQSKLAALLDDTPTGQALPGPASKTVTRPKWGNYPRRILRKFTLRNVSLRRCGTN